MAIGVKVRSQLELVIVLSYFARAEEISGFETRFEMEGVRVTRNGQVDWLLPSRPRSNEVVVGAGIVEIDALAQCRSRLWLWLVSAILVKKLKREELKRDKWQPTSC